MDKLRYKKLKAFKAKWAAAGLCNNCGCRPVDTGKKRCKKCNDKSLSQYYKLTDKQKAIRKERAKKNWQKHGEKYRANYRAYRARIKKQVMDHYGGKCACCGVANLEFLAIDHINGGGRKHRREALKGQQGGYYLYRWLIENKYPKGFRVLCHNCNQSFGMFGYCPHGNLPKLR